MVSVVEGGQVVWTDSSPFLLRLMRNFGTSVAIAAWDGHVLCFDNGALSSDAKLDGTIGDMRHWAGHWLLGTWKTQLATIQSGKKPDLLPDVFDGVYRIAVMKSNDWFAVADLNGGISLYQQGHKVKSIAPLEKLNGIEFSGRHLLAITETEIRTISLDGSIINIDNLEIDDSIQLRPSLGSDECLIIRNKSEAYRIDGSGRHLPLFNLPKGHVALSLCSVSDRLTVKLPDGGCALWEKNASRNTWPDALRATLSYDGKIVAVVYPDKVGFYGVA
jgi:hypothetical protein